MTRYRIAHAKNLVTVEHGMVHPDRLTLFSTMRDELGFLPAWLDHHRGLGFEQFLIWDDQSDDGSFEFLCAQPDCIVLRAPMRFGDLIDYTDPEGQTRRERVGTYLKIALPPCFLPGRYVSYLDADEFLILPPGVAHVGEVISRLAGQGASSAVASVVEFFPAGVAGLEGRLPQDFDALLAAYPYFEPEPLVQLRPGEPPVLTGQSKTARLFERYGIEPRVERRGWHRLYMPARAKKAQMFQKSPRHKTPIVLRSDESYLTGSHNANLPPSASVLLTVAHFVFTAQFADKIERATRWGAHANAAAKYGYYRKLLDAMGDAPDGFLGPESVAYSDAGQLVDAGLMRW
ncbi:glycosyltransferase family 2 protein [Cognatishimia sp. F0-27]|uniref:glycosyltransferase family 2 protein n=1 Tax=Cognatishimia sp. F0-27 TaxID=2816855 RepID=UPI001D0C5D30|nr:glycosyltransferase family 2 protein [Cognatishimia sp. F0-27]MCC1493612.1 glycosyltransferase family 2 protein [Cognatishimia sp. F0-27]